MASNLLSSLYSEVIPGEQLQKGFTNLAQSLDDLKLDVPDACEVLALFWRVLLWTTFYYQRSSRSCLQVSYRACWLCQMLVKSWRCSWRVLLWTTFYYQRSSRSWLKVWYWACWMCQMLVKS